ncbi:MAG: VanZ family protein [Sediminibacterium sp.]
MSSLERSWKNGLFKPILFCLFFITSLILFTLPANKVPRVYWLEIPNFDKIIHAGIFAALCISAYLWLSHFYPKSEKKIAIIIVLVMAAYGIAIEFIQVRFIEGRSFEELDIAADFTGCIIFLLCRPLLKLF